MIVTMAASAALGLKPPAMQPQRAGGTTSNRHQDASALPVLEYNIPTLIDIWNIAS
jgi:hypothetical protein